MFLAGYGLSNQLTPNTAEEEAPNIQMTEDAITSSVNSWNLSQLGTIHSVEDIEEMGWVHNDWTQHSYVIFVPILETVAEYRNWAEALGIEFTLLMLNEEGQLTLFSDKHKATGGIITGHPAGTDVDGRGLFIALDENMEPLPNQGITVYIEYQADHWVAN